MKPHTKHILIALAIGVGVYVVWEMIQAAISGVEDVGSILMAPFNAIGSAVASVGSTASAITAAASSVNAGNTAAAQVTAMNNSQYAPGGSIYNSIAASQGTAAANAAWQTVQNNQATQASQTVTLDPLTWF